MSLLGRLATGTGDGSARAAAVAEILTLVRYGFVGGLVVVVYVTLSIAIVAVFHPDKQVASAVAFSAAAVVSYLGHHRVTFGATGAHGSYVPRFVAVLLFGYAVSFAIIHLLVGRGMTSYTVAVMIVAVAVPAVSYVCNRLLVFRSVSLHHYHPASAREAGRPDG